MPRDWLLAVVVVAAGCSGTDPRASAVERCVAEDLDKQLVRLTRDQHELDGKIEDVIGQLSFATTQVERDEARARLGRLHAEAIDLQERASWLRRIQHE